MKEYFLVILKLLFLDTMKIADGHDFVCVYVCAHACDMDAYMYVWLSAEEGSRAWERLKEDQGQKNRYSHKLCVSRLSNPVGSSF